LSLACRAMAPLYRVAQPVSIGRSLAHPTATIRGSRHLSRDLEITQGPR